MANISKIKIGNNTYTLDPEYLGGIPSSNYTSRNYCATEVLTASDSCRWVIFRINFKTDFYYGSPNLWCELTDILQDISLPSHVGSEHQSNFIFQANLDRSTICLHPLAGEIFPVHADYQTSFIDLWFDSYQLQGTWDEFQVALSIRSEDVASISTFTKTVDEYLPYYSDITPRGQKYDENGNDIASVNDVTREVAKKSKVTTSYSNQILTISIT